MGTIFEIHKSKGQGCVFCLSTESGGVELSCFPFYPEKRGRISIILSREECAWLLLSLQHKFGRQPLGVRTKTGRGNSKRVVRTKTANNKIIRRGLPIKNRTLYKIK